MPTSPARAALAGAALAAFAAAAPEARAAAIERTIPSTTRILYETGRYAEVGLAWVDPHQDGSGADLAVLGQPIELEGTTGDLFDAEWTTSAAWKADLGPRLSYALVLDQPYGAATTYPGGASPVAAFYAGTTASLDTWQLAGVLAWDATSSVKLYGGLRAQWLEASAAVPFLAGYSVDGAGDWGAGYLLGAAWQRPEIALRVALTYYSAISHALATDEATAGASMTSTTRVRSPQSAALEIQSGVAPATLAFGSVRWVDWSDFDIAPPLYAGMIGEPLVDYAGDWWTWTAGLAHQFTDAFAASLALSYEPALGGALSTLGPHDGRTTATAAASYDFGAADLSGGITWGRLGDTSNALATRFDDGSVLGIGLRLGVHF